ncbi:hypothetical protein GGX14DRAFT_694665 [Mycena pura]|uniref:F-box domain-containing protein n=1 Tax=Mycena pura TaxID=153505 RepID=A0AAD6YH29_9AGAR|nr:hypothetical protein GGX14DRAFT_694665 [Mycena pura]
MLSSPFTSKFGTNYSAGDNEVTEIETILIEPSRRLEFLDDEIAKMQRVIDKLTEERNTLAAYIDGHRSLLSPMRRLPRDIIQEIFIACMPTDRNCVMSATEAPILLGRICSAWRAISFSTPRLWADIHIVEPDYRTREMSLSNGFLDLVNAKLKQRLEVTEAWLHRSGQCGLSITVFCTTPMPQQTRSPIIQAIIPLAPRWEHISLTASDIVLANLPTFSDGDMPMLKSLCINEVQTMFPEGHRWDTMSLCRAPQLSRFSASGSCFRPLELPLRWDRLLELSLVKTSPPTLSSDMALQVLSWCSVLRTFKALVEDYTDAGGVSVPPLEHASLRTLDFECMGSLSSTALQLTGRLLLPDLRHFLIHGSTAGNEDDISRISYAPFLAASSKITHVKVMLIMFTKSSLAEFIRCLPQTTEKLEVLRVLSWGPGYMINQIYIDEDILSLLDPSLHTPAASVSCPRLQDLTLKDCTSISDETLRDFIISRMRDGAHSKMRRIVVRFPRAMEVDIMPDLREFVENGLQVELHYYLLGSPEFSPWAGLSDD